MKLLRLKITDPAGFRSLPCGFEHHFRREWTLEEELAQPESFAPFICAGPNGSGKSNLLEALAAIFFQLEIWRVRRSYLPEVLQSDDLDFSPLAFELDYLIKVQREYVRPNGPVWAKVVVWKNPGESVRFQWENQSEFNTNINEVFEAGFADILLPQYVLGYSSGENEILSLPFFKMRFVQFDEYLNSLKQQFSYPGHPETRLVYLDKSFSQAILLCNLLFQDEVTLRPFREDVGIKAIKEFRIVVRRSIEIDAAQFDSFGLEGENAIEAILKRNRALSILEDEIEQTKQYRLTLVQAIEKNEDSNDKIDPIIERLKRCATLSYLDEETDTLILDYWVSDATRQAFHENFEGSPLALFQAFQVLLALNLYSVNEILKTDIYRSDSHYVSETVPTLASDQRIMRFKNVRFTKLGVAEPMMLKELSDGEYQLLHSLGLCLLFRETNSLFLLDEPETHFNPAWRANFISGLRQCLPGKDEFAQEMLITTHTPFLVSDSKPEKVLVFVKDKDSGAVSISNPRYNTLGSSINKITMSTFDKHETIGGYAQEVLERFRTRFEYGDVSDELIDDIQRELGDSVEKILLIRTILDNRQQGDGEAQR